MKKETSLGWMFLIVFVMLCFLLLGVEMLTISVIGSNITNDTTLARVYVWNTEPNITSVFISPSSIELNAGSFVTVNCTAYVWDYNGWQDVKALNATLYDVNYENNPEPDNNYRYFNDSCAPCVQADASGTNASCTCQFRVLYYANNGTWKCNFTITDQGGGSTDPLRNFTFSDSDVSGPAIVNTVLGIDTPDEIDYGNLSVTETSSYIPANVTNWGNVPINISVRGYGGTNESVPGVGNLSMICEFGNITHGYQRYAINTSISYENMTNLSNTSTLIPDFTLPVRTNDAAYGSDNNVTYWKIQIPLTVGGHCNGTIQFNAIDAS